MAEKRPGVRVERHHRWDGMVLFRQVDDPFQDLCMAPVYAVEHAKGDDGAFDAVACVQFREQLRGFHGYMDKPIVLPGVGRRVGRTAGGLRVCCGASADLHQMNDDIGKRCHGGQQGLAVPAFDVVDGMGITYREGSASRASQGV